MSGVDCQPAGSFSLSVPCAAPFTLLCTVHEKSKDCVPTGTAPAAGESVTEIAGPIINGCGTMPSVCTRCIACTTSDRCSATPLYDNCTFAESG